MYNKLCFKKLYLIIIHVRHSRTFITHRELLLFLFSLENVDRNSNSPRILERYFSNFHVAFFINRFVCFRVFFVFVCFSAEFRIARFKSFFFLFRRQQEADYSFKPKKPNTDDPESLRADSFLNFFTLV